MPERIAAVVITRNRLPLLQRFIDHTLAQTRPLDAVYVVDNASTDGTREYLRVCASPIRPILLSDNMGSGGGQNVGMSQAYKDGFDWIWCCDDDGYAEPNALEETVGCMKRTNAKWMNSLVVSTKDPKVLSFGFVSNIEGNPTYISNVADAQEQGDIIDGANPFNGTLIHRDLIDAVGLPSPDLFIKGEDEEYQRRARHVGLHAVTVTNSVYYHPPQTSQTPATLPVKEYWRYYYHIRNCNARVTSDGEVQLSGRDAFNYGKDVALTLTIAIAGNIVKLMIVAKAVVAAFRNDLSRY